MVGQTPELEGDPLNYKGSGLGSHPGCVAGHRTKPCPWFLSLLSDGALSPKPKVGSARDPAHGLPLLPFSTISDFTSVPGQLRGNIRLGGKAAGSLLSGLKARRTLGVPCSGYCN